MTLHDDKISQIGDLCSNFYITKDDVDQKRTRAEASRSRLAELNDYVLTDHITGGLTEKVLKRFDIVVVSDMSRYVTVFFVIECWSKPNYCLYGTFSLVLWF